MTYYIIDPDGADPRYECAECYEWHADSVTAPVERVEHDFDEVADGEDAALTCEFCWKVKLDSFRVVSRVITRIKEQAK